MYKSILECSLTYVTVYLILNCRTIGIEWSGLALGGHTLFSRDGVYRFSIISTPLEGASSNMCFKLWSVRGEV